MNTSFLSALLGSALALSALGCGASATLSTPDGFATLEDQEDYLYRATSAQGVVLAIRGEKNSPKGNLDFWVGAVDGQLRRTGYVPLDKAPVEVRSAGGALGRQMRYVRDQQGRKDSFLAAVFVTESYVYTIEAGGSGDRFDDAAAAKVAESIKTFTFR